MITSEKAAEIRQRNDALMVWVDSIRGKNGWASYRPEDKPANVPDVSNEERSALEVFEFCQTPPDKYFLYIREKDHTAPVTVRAINGHTYHGTYFKSSGDFARIRQSKKKH